MYLVMTSSPVGSAASVRATTVRGAIGPSSVSAAIIPAVASNTSSIRRDSCFFNSMRKDMFNLPVSKGSKSTPNEYEMPDESFLLRLNPLHRGLQLQIAASQQRVTRRLHDLIRLNPFTFKYVAAVTDVIGDRILKSIAVGQRLDDRRQRRAGGGRAEHMRAVDVTQTLSEDFAGRSGATINQDRHGFGVAGRLRIQHEVERLLPHLQRAQLLILALRQQIADPHGHASDAAGIAAQVDHQAAGLVLEF